MTPNTGSGTNPVMRSEIQKKWSKFTYAEVSALKSNDDLVSQVPMQRFRDTIDYHSTVVQAAQTAERGGVRTLVLTHQIPTPGPGTADEWIGIAREHFDGEIVFGEDLTSISV